MGMIRPSVGFYAQSIINPSIASRNGFKFLDMDALLRISINLAFKHFDNFPSINFDTSMFSMNDTAKIEALNRDFSIRRKKIAEELVLAIDNMQGSIKNINDMKLDILFNNIERLHSLKKIIREVVSPLLISDDYILCGKNLLLDLPKFYIIANTDDNIEDLLNRAIQSRRFFQGIANNQLATSIPRSDFRWISNSLLVPIRKIYAQKIKEMIVLHKHIFSEFDLSMQLLMHLGARKISELWIISEELISRWSGQEFGIEEYMEFERLVEKRVIIPNDEVILGELSRIAGELASYFSETYTEVLGSRIDLPSSYMCNIHSSPFLATNARTEITLANNVVMDGVNGKVMVAHEKITGKKIIFSEVSPEVSLLYSRGFCNLHYANTGEVAVYGAFVEGDDLPFAYSSYGSISYNYTKEMLSYLGYMNGEIIESSRAWNAVWAPENTMSVLFSYSQERLKEKFGNNLKGILTSINPNLGFTASAFRAIHFEIVSLKPTVFSYQLDGPNAYFKLKKEIAKNLGLKITDLSNSPLYTENKIPFLPTVELLYLYDKEERKKLATSPIYVVSKNDYLFNR